jgi:hypothetical protein
MKNLTVTLFSAIILSLPAWAQQWTGPNNTSSAITRTGYLGLGIASNSNVLYPLHVFDNTGVGTKTLFGSSGSLFGSYAAADAVHQIRSTNGIGVLNVYANATSSTSFHSIGLSTSSFGNYLSYQSSTLSPVNFVILGNNTERLRILNDGGTKILLGGASGALTGAFGNVDAVLQQHSTGNGYMGIVSNKAGSNYVHLSMGTVASSGYFSLTTVGISPMPLTFFNNNIEAMRIWPSGAIGVGTTTAPLNNTKFAVEGLISCRELKVMPLAAAWPDYVFSPGYQRMSFEQLDAFIQANHHLPHMPSDSTFNANGNSFNVGETQMNMLRSMEELYLYMLDLKKENDALRQEMEELKKK